MITNTKIDRPLIYGAHDNGYTFSYFSPYPIVYIYVCFLIKKLPTFIHHETFSFLPKNYSISCYIPFLEHTGYMIHPLFFLFAPRYVHSYAGNFRVLSNSPSRKLFRANYRALVN